jgi:hypothetical protein
MSALTKGGLMNRFDEVAKALAGAQTRRQALGRIAGGLAGGVLAAVGLREARGDPAPNSTCQDYCAAFFPPPRGKATQNAYGKCVSGCQSCVQAGGVTCGSTPECCFAPEVCDANSGTCVSPNTCDNPIACANPCGTGDCACFPTTEGGAFCGQGIPCATAIVCVTSSDCPAGWACTETCCGGLICEPPCGGAFAAAVAGAGPTSTGN